MNVSRHICDSNMFVSFGNIGAKKCGKNEQLFAANASAANEDD